MQAWILAGDGLAFVYDPADTFAKKINPAMIGLERVIDAAGSKSLRDLISLHFRFTVSKQAQKLVDTWDAEVGKFWKVVPFPPTPQTPKSIYAFDPARIHVGAV